MNVISPSPKTRPGGFGPIPASPQLHEWMSLDQGVLDRPLTAEKVRDQWDTAMADGPWTPLPAGSGDIGRMLAGFEQ